MTRAKLTGTPGVLPPDPVEQADRTTSRHSPIESSPHHQISKNPTHHWALLTLILIVVITPGALIGVALVVMVKRLLHRRAA